MERQTEIRLVYNLSNVNLKEKTGTLRVREEDKRSGYVLQVALSGQLVGKIKYAMKNPKSKYAEQLTNVDFCSTLKSDSYKENPLKLIKFEDGSFKVQMVSDKGFYIKTYVNAMNKRVEETVYKHWKKSQYIRYWDLSVSK